MSEKSHVEKARTKASKAYSAYRMSEKVLHYAFVGRHNDYTAYLKASSACDKARYAYVDAYDALEAALAAFAKADLASLAAALIAASNAYESAYDAKSANVEEAKAAYNDAYAAHSEAFSEYSRRATISAYEAKKGKSK